MTFNKIKLVILALIIFTTGCIRKDDLTLPVKVHFKIGISSDNFLNIEYLAFTECQIGIQGIQFEGKREAGTDIFFETDSKMDLQTISFLQPVSISTFDVPQGIYTYMKWDIIMKCIDTEGLIGDRNEYDPCIGIIISGIYKSLEGSEIPFIFAIDEPELFSVRSYDPDNNSKIVLSVRKEYEATVLFDPGKAFSTITRESLENAEPSGDGENLVIIISSSKNQDLYEILLYRIFQSAKVVVK